MLKIIKRVLIFFIFLIWGNLYAQQVVDVNYQKIDFEEKITIKLTQAVDPWSFFLKNPDRLVVDFKNTLWTEGKKQIDVNSDTISSIRWAQNSTQPLNFRVVIDLKKDIDRKISSSFDGKEIYILISPRIDTKTDNERINIVAGKVFTAEELTKSTTEKSSYFVDENLSTKSDNFSRSIETLDSPLIEGFSTKDKFSIFVKGQKLKLRKNVYWQGGRILLPAKDFFELLGFDFYYDKTRKISTFRKGQEIEVKIKPNSDLIYVNGEERQLSTKTALVKGVLYIPFISVSNNISLQVYWDKKKKNFYVGEIVKDISFISSKEYFSIVITSSSNITTYDALFDEKSSSFLILLPNLIVNTKEKEFFVNKENIKNLKLLQDGPNTKVVVYVLEQIPVKIDVSNNKLNIFFPAVIRKISFIEDEKLVKFYVKSTRPIDVDIKRFQEPDRIVVDFANSIYQAQGYLEVNKGGILRIRASQFKSDPPTSRVVIDTEKELPYNYQLLNDGKLLLVTVEKYKREYAKPQKDEILKGKVIVIDPGHGGHDPGAIGISGEHIKEKDINLSVALRLAKLLSDAGAIPLLTRDSDVFISLQDRVDFTKRNNPDIFISIHFNLSENRNITGTETYYYNDNSKLLAQIIHNNLTFNLKRNDGGVRKVKFFVVSKNTVPSILIEPLYLSDPHEEAIALHKDWQDFIARILYVGIKQYFEVLKK